MPEFEVVSEHLESPFRTPSPLVEPRTEQWLRRVYRAAEQINFGGLSLRETQALLNAEASVGDNAVALLSPTSSAQAPITAAAGVPKPEKDRYLLSRAWKEAYSCAVSVEGLGYPITVAMSHRETSVWDNGFECTLVQAVKKYFAAHLLGSYCAEAFNLLKRPDEDALEVDMFRTQFAAKKLIEDRVDRAPAIELRVSETPHIHLLYNIFVIDYLGRILDIFSPKAANDFDIDANRLCQEALRELQARLRDTEHLLNTDAGQIYNLTALTDMLKSAVDPLREGGTLNTSLRTVLREKMDNEFTLNIHALSEVADQVHRAIETPAGLSIEPTAAGVPFLRHLRERMCLLLKRLFSYL